MVWLFAAGALSFIAQAFVVYVLLSVVFHLFKWHHKFKFRWLLILSYPTVYAAVGGWIGIIIPLPSLLSLPIWIVYALSPDKILGDNDILLPLPLVSYNGGFQMMFVAEIGILCCWFAFVYWISQRKKWRNDSSI